MQNTFILVGYVNLVMLGSFTIRAQGEEIEVLVPDELSEYLNNLSGNKLIGVSGKITSHGLVANKFIGVEIWKEF